MLHANGWVVYRHTSPDDKVYVGITSIAPKQRWSRGAGYAQNARFHDAIRQYGWDAFKHEIIAEHLTYQQAILMESDLIAKYNSTDPACGYNRSKGCAPHVSERYRLKVIDDPAGFKRSMGKMLTAVRGCQPIEAIASLCGITTASLRDYENGERIPRDEIKERLARVYGYRVRKIFYDD